jgi:hypothetical protein
MLSLKLKFKQKLNQKLTHEWQKLFGRKPKELAGSRKESHRLGRKIAAKKAIARAGAATLTAFTLLSCGPMPGSNPMTTPPTTSGFRQGNQTFTNDYTSLSPQKIAALMGTYDLALTRQTYDYMGGTINTQMTASMQLTHMTQPGASISSWGALKFSVTEGMTVVDEFQSYIGIDVSNLYGYAFFATPIISHPEFIQSNFALLIGLRLNGAGQVDPTQSMVYIMDCGFSQTSVCSNPVSGLKVQAILRKR